MSHFTIVRSTLDDVDTHMRLYDEAIRFQQKMGHNNWIPFERERVIREMKEGIQYKIIDDASGEVAGVFIIEESDPAIWGERDKDPSFYIHRITTNPQFRGNNLVSLIVNYLKENADGKSYIRMDTKNGNEKLIRYYIDRCGFSPAGTIALGDVPTLPKHFQNIDLFLFEMKV
ncbi:Acetyltransferase (GNAT) family, putative [Angomonas deanei]|uniref:Acetyltransferase (GNAT) family, putative n=1 Tax=Angomonas deanei TaxID=59799 RepID=A0A7G2CPK8_9TRYP|nr:Acetyltransferase (GNAT) family, putative [Angomonas deanei]